MIIRDQYDIIVQHKRSLGPEENFEPHHTPNGEVYYLDANAPGDSISRTAISAVSKLYPAEVWNLRNFEISPGRFARHPYTEPWNNYASKKYGASRDQRTCYVAALKIFGLSMIAERLRKKTGFFVVNDFLLPDLKWLDALAANHWSKYLWGILGLPNTVFSILWSCYVTPNHELNQIGLQCAAVGDWALCLLTKCHPDWVANIEDYFGVCNERNKFNPHGKWRDQPELAIAFINYIKGRLNDKTKTRFR